VVSSWVSEARSTANVVKHKASSPVMASSGPLTYSPFAALADVVRASANAVAEQPAPTVVDPPSALVGEGEVRLRRETKGRGGKTVVRVTGLPAHQLTALVPQMKKALGCGATIEGPDLVLLGSVEERAAEWLRQAGAERVMVCSRARGAQVGAEGTERARIHRGQRVSIVLKADQQTGVSTEGVVRDVLTSSATHPHGIKVRLESGLVGRVNRILG
jgi:uncharacterized repeat protein (TIGR03833 family)